MAVKRNPRWLAYCAAQGRAPAAQLKHDAALYPGGKMCGYMLWMNERIEEWCRLNGVERRPGVPWSLNDLTLRWGEEEAAQRFLHYLRSFAVSGQHGPTRRILQRPDASAQPSRDRH